MRHLRLPALILAGLAGACAQTQHNPALAHQRYLLGADLYNKGQLRPALEELLKAIAADPDAAEAHNLIGVVFLREGVAALDEGVLAQCLVGDERASVRGEADEKFRRAEHHFREALRAQPSLSEVHNSLAVVALHFGELERAIAEAQAALKDILYKEPHVALGNLGWAYYQKHDLVRAARELRQAVFHEPRFCVGHYRLARVYYDQGDVERALEEVTQVVREPLCPIQEAHELAGLANLKQHRSDEAAAAFRRCEALAPRSCLSQECRRYARLAGGEG